MARTLSGGEQQILALARVLVVRPKLLIADEPSLGLAPVIIDRLYEALRTARSAGISILLIEQFVDRALRFADRIAFLRRGHIVWSGTTEDVSPEVLHGYM
jgi:branched-chain amino acid transport system ATP-binding protein